MRRNNNCPIIVLFFIISLFFLSILPNSLDFPGNQGIPNGMKNPIPACPLLMVQGE